MIYYSFVCEIKFNCPSPSIPHSFLTSFVMFFFMSQTKTNYGNAHSATHFLYVLLSLNSIFFPLVSFGFNLWANTRLIDHHKNPAYIQLSGSEYSSHCFKKHLKLIVTLTRSSFRSRSEQEKLSAATECYVRNEKWNLMFTACRFGVVGGCKFSRLPCA